MPTDTEPLELTEVQWQVADAIARKLVIEGTDVNELRKTIAYLREYVDREKAGKAFFDYLKTLVRRGNQIGHSKQTINYYKSLDAACEQYLKNFQDKAPQMLMILGWAARLVQYYSKGVPTGEIDRPTVTSEREAEIQIATLFYTFEVGQQIEAGIKDIKSGKITCEMFGVFRLSPKDPRLAKELSVGQIVVVEILELKDDGSPKKIKILKQ